MRHVGRKRKGAVCTQLTQKRPVSHAERTVAPKPTMAGRIAAISWIKIGFVQTRWMLFVKPK
jgi:hypothetical protein